MSKHRRGNVYDAMYAARDARRKLWIQSESANAFITRIIARERVSQGIDRWEDDGGPCR